MRYVSTRGRVPPASFEEVLFAGLAADGGLFVPQSWPLFDRDRLAELQSAPYQEVAAYVLEPFVGDDLTSAELRRMIDDAYSAFSHQAIAPVKQLAAGEWVMELFHGPTLAFKDVALQLLGLLFEHFLARRDGTITIVGATSGDTGSAAIATTAGRAHMRTVILHPKDRVSEIQRRQMTTVEAANIHNIAIEGTFDDCQALVKAMFGDRRFRERLNLSAINSINWGRIMAQIVYYVSASLALGGPWRRLSFSVPSGNFGNVYAGYAAARMGLPIEQLIVATNRNDILARFFETGIYQAGDVAPTVSPSMDIQVASNFERLLFDLCDRDGQRVQELMAGFVEERMLSVGDDALGRARELFTGYRVDEEQTLAVMADIDAKTGEMIDPHTAVGIAAATAAAKDSQAPVVTFATAHPAKFPEAVERAIGRPPIMPPKLEALMSMPERLTVLPNDLAAVQAHIDHLPIAN
ncbi:MAG: threonine synthase [Alphaproteobacteria bacterium]|nr:threonine synthase [Alphaproteobacteria bacterium]